MLLRRPEAKRHREMKPKNLRIASIPDDPFLVSGSSSFQTSDRADHQRSASLRSVQVVLAQPFHDGLIGVSRAGAGRDVVVPSRRDRQGVSHLDSLGVRPDIAQQVVDVGDDFVGSFSRPIRMPSSPVRSVRFCRERRIDQTVPTPCRTGLSEQPRRSFLLRPCERSSRRRKKD